MWNNYFSVTCVQEALELLAHYRETARIIAGGTDLIIELDRGQRSQVETLIDISRVPELDYITVEHGIFKLGALATHNHVVAHPELINHALPLAQACWEVGAPQIRNRGTVAGNLITASPANDTITPLWALGASVTLHSLQGERSVLLEDFYQGVRKTVMRPDELLTSIQFPALQNNQRGIFLKLGLRKAQAISVVNVAVILTFDEDHETIIDARLTYGSVAPTILRLLEVEALLIGKKLSDEIIVNAAKTASQIVQPITDVRGTAAYRREMTKVLTARALRTLHDHLEQHLYPVNPAMLWGEAQAHITRSLTQLIRHEDDAGDTIATIVNGQRYICTGGSNKTLLDFLRDDIGLTGTKEGCAEGECGACTVFLDGVAVMACMVPSPRAHDAEIVTIEGLADGDTLHPLQQAFIETGAVQCGFCIPGFLMSGAKLLEEYPQPSQAQITQSISGNLCRCTGYYKILEAFQKASQESSPINATKHV
jgi:carbon-monoxide dehydrogenase medium subunit